MSAQTTSHALTWLHQDSDPQSTMAALFGSVASPVPIADWTRRPDGTLLNTKDRVRLVRGLAVATEYAIENLRTQGVDLPSGEMQTMVTLRGDVRGELYPDASHCYAASTLARTWMVFNDPGVPTVYSAQTKDGDPATLVGNVGGDAAFPPLLIAVVAVVAVAAFAAALVYASQVAGEVIDRKLTRDELTTQLMTTQARAVKMVDDHTEREKAAGHPIPWSPEERAVLDGLLATQQQIAGRSTAPLPNPFPGAVTKVADAARKATQGIGLATAAAVLGVAYVVSRKV